MNKNLFHQRPNSYLFPIVGPSGVGKNHLIEGLLKSPRVGRNLEFMITHTSRKPRGKEQNRLHYYFVTAKGFRDMIAEDAFAEYNQVYPGKYYGTSYEEIARVVGQHGHGISDIDVDGALALKLLFPNNVHSIFLQPQSMEQAVAQLRARSEQDNVKEGDIQDRINRFNYEMSMKGKFDSLITSIAGGPEHALQYAEEIIFNKVYSGQQAFIC